tara:strand:- start:1225 stop:1722 length:498 start_codon:yes stop_codon:yes gene_type:complete
MNLRSKRRISASILKCGKHKVKFDEKELSKIKESITRSDIRGLIKDKIIIKRPIKGVSKARSRHLLKQKRKGRRKGPGSKKGTHNTRLPPKKEWMAKIRAIRTLLKLLRKKQSINSQNYNKLYNKAKGGFFRSRRHVKLYIKEHNLEQNETKQKKGTTPKKETSR